MADAWKGACQRTYQGWWVEDGSRRSSAVIRMYRRTTRRRLKRTLQGWAVTIGEGMEVHDA